MCGIAGFYGFRNDNLIKKFSEQLSHRGPDGEGFYIQNQVTLLNRRLAIIDRKGGDQPIFNEDKSVVVTYNGEIYNYLKLRHELKIKGHVFKTKSDTEVIVHGYEEWGDKCFDRFNGMFAVALYDIKKKKLILARDHFGIKPLYFILIDKDSATQFLSHESLTPRQTRGPLESEKIAFASSFKFIFSSEIKPLIYSGLITKIPNDRIIYRYLCYRIHDDQRETFFEGVYKLMPGEMIIIQNSKLRFQNYTNLKNDLLMLGHPTGVQARNLSKERIKEFKKELVTAIRLRLISEVPVGTCLSGGLDSSTVVMIVNKLLNEHVTEARSIGKIQNTFSAVFPGSSNDEGKYIDQVLKSIKLKSHKVYPESEEFFKEIEGFVRTQEEPTISTGPYAQYKVMQEAHKYVAVLLDGQGADEMMAGYTPYYFVYLRQLWKEKKFLTFAKEFPRSINIISDTLIKHLIEVLKIKKKVIMSDLLDKKFANLYKKEIFNAENYHLKKRLIEDIFFNSLPSLLRYEDKNAMRFSIEGRVPFLDFNLLRYLFSLPDEAIIKNGWNKYILRQSIKDLLPELILKRRNKIGFTTPEYDWFMRMKNKIYSIFLSESFAKRKYFNQPEVLKAFQKFIEAKSDDTMLFWRLLNLEMWMRIFLDEKDVKRLTSSRVNEFGPNEDKKLEIRIDGKEYLRFPIRTELFKKGDNLENKIVKLLNGYIAKNNSAIKQFSNCQWSLVVSEKIVAIAQGRSYFIWDIKTGFWANLLAKFVKKTPYGIGLGSPWTMQLAINEKGLLRIILAAVAGKMLQLFGVKGGFYRIAGRDIASIDGPTEYSLYPSNVSAKLGPKEPRKVAQNIHNFLISNFQFPTSKQVSKSQISISNFLGVVIIDANDLGQRVLGNSTPLPNSIIEKIFVDNPMGQADEQTPLVLVLEKNSL